MDNLPQTIQVVEERKKCDTCYFICEKECNKCYKDGKVKGYTAKEMTKAFDFALQAIKEKISTDTPQPLTLEELMQMNSEPVYVKNIGLAESGYWILINGKSGLRENSFVCANIDEADYTVDYNTYGKTWIAYRNRPKEEKV